jgi:hypothetical protein
MDIPLQYGGTSHSLYIASHNLRIPLTLRGLMSGFSSRKPTLEEYMNMPKVVMTRDFQWDPNSDTHAEAESMMTAVIATVNYVPDPLHFELDDTVRHILAIDAHERVLPECDDTPLELDLYHRLIANVTVAPDDIPGHGLDGHLESSVYIQHDNLRQIGKLTSSEIIHLDSGDTC